ncbi:type III secretion system inner rod subunit SctI [Serratia symbiotica]|uniref:type III secretion system inner rod subunit SctI n=1 Tax=Serratia symbiotica TaxID=138074 RepID=UPI001CF0AC67|nr:type III secretion system inner rod subunit SctI [Serratia symbiotica]
MPGFINFSPIIHSVVNNDEIMTGDNYGIEDRVRNLFSTYTAAATQEKTNIINQLKYGDATNPAVLLELQNRVGNYSLAINMVSTLTHRGASAIDSVLKAQ